MKDDGDWTCSEPGKIRRLHEGFLVRIAGANNSMVSWKVPEKAWPLECTIPLFETDSQDCLECYCSEIGSELKYVRVRVKNAEKCRFPVQLTRSPNEYPWLELVDPQGRPSGWLSVEKPAFRVPLRQEVLVELRNTGSRTNSKVVATLHLPEGLRLEAQNCRDEEFINTSPQRNTVTHEDMKRDLFKSLKKLKKDLQIAEEAGEKTIDRRAVTGLQPQLTGAFEDFCRFVLLDGLIRLVYLIDPLALLGQRSSNQDVSDQDRNSLMWLDKLLRWLQKFREPEFEDQCRNLRNRRDGPQRTPEQRLEYENKIREIEEKQERKYQEFLSEVVQLFPSAADCNTCQKKALVCPICKAEICCKEEASRRCLVSDFHPLGPLDPTETREKGVNKLLKWALEQMITHYFMRNPANTRDQFESGFQGLQPILREWTDALNFFLPSELRSPEPGQSGRKIIDAQMKSALNDQRLTVSSWSERGREEKFSMKGISLDGFRSLLSLKYGMRCTAVHGSNAATLKQSVRGFPTAQELAQLLLGAAETSSLLDTNTLRAFLESSSTWDLYWLEMDGLLTRQQWTDLETKDWRHNKDVLKFKGPLHHVTLKKRSEVYSFGEGDTAQASESSASSPHEEGESTAETSIKVTCKSNQREPMTTSVGKIKEGNLAELEFNLHFCYKTELQDPHQWMKVRLKPVPANEPNGYPYMEGKAEVYWNGPESDLSRQERHFDRADAGRLMLVQLHPTLKYNSEREDKDAALGIAKFWRKIYDRIEHCERHAFFYKNEVEADLNLTRLAAVTLANTVVKVFDVCFGVKVAKLASMEELSANPHDVQEGAPAVS